MKKLFLILAWRNIWRNKKRAFITISSIAASLFFVLFLRQMQFWVYDFNIKNSVAATVGYIQITDSSYVDEKIIDNTLSSNQVDVEALTKIEGVKGVYPRFLSGALVSTGIKSKYAGISGISPETDNKLLKLDIKLRKGTLINADDRAIMITENMADYYQVSVGDSLILMGQGYHGFTAAGIYPIKAILNFPVGELSSMVFMPIKEAQFMHVADNRFTHVLIDIESNNQLEEIYSEVKKVSNDSQISVRTWEEVVPGLKQGIDMDANSGLIISGILYMIVGFGIFGTIVMLHNERKFEFGVLNAIGTNRFDLLFITLTELTILTLIGIVIGNLSSLPLLYYFNQNPIKIGGDAAQAVIDQGFEPYMGTGLFLDVFTANSLAILAIATFVSLYIVIKIIRINALKSMKK
ncbi:ABC transporter permease [Flavicella marina]|uniref:ABC transporter permease n=1 Tax=Flavicella marina TaxID=1475951 RepID=UPI0012644974|nr:FtsX-like permease family protein [Flavicella marina]